MIGAIAGDFIGSRFEARPIKRTDFQYLDPQCHVTDDSMLTVAVAHAILHGSPCKDSLQAWRAAIPIPAVAAALFDGFGNPQPYESWGNGSAMRVSPAGLALDSIFYQRYLPRTGL
jgi:ADP-ribosylglycohydrolase